MTRNHMVYNSNNVRRYFETMNDIILRFKASIILVMLALNGILKNSGCCNTFGCLV